MKKLSNPVRICLRVAGYVVISLLLAFGIYRWNAETLAGNRLPMPFGMGTAVVLSGSMEPELSVNDLVFVKAAKDYEVGEVVVYQSGNILIIHRIIEISSDGKTVTTKGDANNVADDPIDISAIKGKMTGKIPDFGGFIAFLRSPIVVVMLFAGVVALMVFSGRSEKKAHAEETAAISEEIRQLKEEKAKRSEEDSANGSDTPPDHDETV